MKTLVVDSLPVACSALARGIREILGCDALCASSTAGVLRCLRAEKDTIGVIVLSLELGPEAGLSFIQQVKEHCNAEAIRVPRFVTLTPGPLSPGYEHRFRIIGAECLLLGFEPQVYTTVRRMMFESVCEKGRPTIIVDRSGSDTRFFILGPVRSELILCGPRLVPIFNYMAIHYGTEMSTRTLAEVADISEPYVRVYLHRLKSRYDQARMKVGVGIQGKEVFRTFRRDGGYVHVLSARVMFA